jgi:Ca-activated chloride channel family protein
VGLILFGSQAYLQAPLTFDRHTVRTWLDEARIGIAGKNTAIGDAIGLASSACASARRKAAC